MKLKQRLLTLLATAALVIGMFPAIPAMADTETDAAVEKSIYVLYTNDVHCEVSGYPALAAYREQLMQNGADVVTVDAGDAIQGEAIGTQTNGSAIIDIMNTVGYDYAVPGNHEFDYSMSTFLDLTQNADFTYLSANFVDLRTGSTVFEPYAIRDFDGQKVAFIGIATPESYTKSRPTYFQDEDGNLIYGFCGDNFYDTIQNAVDQAKSEGADIIIAIGHLGITDMTEGWRSTDVIANTTGIDAFIDGHSHETIPEQTYYNKDGQDVPLSSTGSKFANFGVMTISTDIDNNVSITTTLVQPSDVNIDNSEAAQTVQKKIDDYNSELSYLYEVLGTSDVTLSENDADGNWVIRKQETNLGDFVTDAYRAISKADIAIVNGGGIRTSINAGEITRKNLIDVNPFNNGMCVIEVTGQQILDALEHGVQDLPGDSGGFLHVSGLTYNVDTWKESPVILDDQNMFASIDSSKERRVCNVKVNDQNLDPAKTYTVCGSDYILLNNGSGYTMFKDATVLANKELPTDTEMLISYFTDILNGRITAEQYGNIDGEGRILIHTDASQHPRDDNKKDPGKETEVPETRETESESESQTESETKETETTTPSDKNNKKTNQTTTKKTASSTKTAKKAVKTGDTTPVEPLAFTAITSAVVIIAIAAKKKKNF